MKKLIILSLLLGNIAFAMPNKKISLLLSDKKEEAVLEKSFKTETENLGYRLNTYNAENDFEKQPSQIQAAIVNATSAIVIEPLDFQATTKDLNDAISRKVPVVTLNSKVNDVDVLAHITSDDKHGASLAAEWLVKKSDVHPKELTAIIHLVGVEPENVHEARYNGFKNYLMSQSAGSAWNDIPKHKDKYIEIDLSQEKSDKTFEENLKILNPKGKYVIYSENDSMAIKAIQSIESNDKFDLKNFTVIGFDGSPDARQMVDDGKMALTVTQDFDTMAKEGTSIINNYLTTGEKPKESVKLIKTGLYPDHFDVKKINKVKSSK